jgi:hypothetical protein
MTLEGKYPVTEDRRLINWKVQMDPNHENSKHWSQRDDSEYLKKKGQYTKE